MASGEYLLAIGAGLYAGTSHPLPAGTYVIGGSVEADLVLMGEGLAPRHAKIVIGGCEASVEALADGVSLAGFGKLKASRAVMVTLPFELSVGNVSMSWTGPVGQPDTALSVSRDLRLFSGARVRSAAVVGVVAVSVVAAASSLVAADPGSAGSFVGANLRQAMAAAPSETVGLAKPERTQRRAAPQADLINQAGEELKVEIDKAGLLNIAVDTRGGIVMTRGTVEPSAAGRWQAIEQWFDQRFKGEVLLVNAVAVKAEKVPSSLAIEAVWRGAQSHLVIRGQKYLEGAMLDDGWSIRRIELERVVLERDGRLVAVRY